jgi:hypothetical protein
VSGAPPAAFLLEVLRSAGSGAWFSLKVAALLVPALVLYELLAPLPIFARWGRLLGPRLARLGISPACTVPLAAGFFLGIAYGAGIIITVAEDERIGPREIGSLGLFLCTCHAVVEDTLLFALIGARGPWEVAGRATLLAAVRLALAIGVTGAGARLRPALEAHAGPG